MKLFLLELFTSDPGKESGRAGHLASANSSCGRQHTKNVGQLNALQKKGLPHPALCPLCDQVEETLDHLLVSCVFSRQFWFNLLQGLGLQALAPGLDDEIFDDWWDNLSSRVSCQIRKGANYLVILGAWNLWNHQNMCVFDGAVPDLNSILSTTREDLQLWSVAGAKGISSLLAPATT